MVVALFNGSGAVVTGGLVRTALTVNCVTAGVNSATSSFHTVNKKYGVPIVGIHNLIRVKS